MADDGQGYSVSDGANEVVEVTQAEIVDAIEDSAPSIARRITHQQTSVSMEGWRGPLPRPADLAEYEKILPGAANRILTMAETTVQTQATVETTLATGDVQSIRRGQWMMWSIGAIGGIGLLIAALDGNAAIAVASATLSSAPTWPKIVRAIRERPSKEDPAEDSEPSES